MGRRALPARGSFERAQLDQARDRKVVEFVLSRVPPQPKWGALEGAVRAAADRFEVDRRTVQRALRRYQDAAPLRAIEQDADRLLGPSRRLQRALEPGLRIAAALETIEQNITATELEEMSAVSLSTVLKFALARRGAPLPHRAEKISGKK